MAVLVGAWLAGCAHHDDARPVATAPAIQQRLGTRAQAFARYLTAMHRQIHSVYTLGFLADADARNVQTYADQTLWTQVAIAVNADGRIDRVEVLRTSGLPAFDGVVLESVRAAAPFPPPPDSIKSSDGKVHLDWQFHRDERSCGTFGVDPHIYGPGGKEDKRWLAEAVELTRGEATAGAARSAAIGWFAAYVRRDPAWLAGWSAVPFLADGEVIARDGGALKKFYAELVAASPVADSAVADFKLLTSAAMLGAPVTLPTGAKSDMMLATGRVGGTSITLLLMKSSQGWRVCGLNRESPAASESQPAP